MVRELGVHVQHLQQVVPMDLVQVAVSEGPHVPVGLARPRVEVQRLSKNVILPWRPWRGGTQPPAAAKTTGTCLPKFSPTSTPSPQSRDPEIYQPAPSSLSSQQCLRGKGVKAGVRISLSQLPLPGNTWNQPAGPAGCPTVPTAQASLGSYSTSPPKTHFPNLPWPAIAPS